MFRSFEPDIGFFSFNNYFLQRKESFDSISLAPKIHWKLPRGLILKMKGGIDIIAKHVLKVGLNT